MSAIYKRELNAYFTSPIAYVVYAVASFFAGLLFVATVLERDTSDMTYLFRNMTTIIIMMIPILTMKLFSEEKNKKTEQGLLTAPVNLLQIVMGKVLAAVTVYALLMVLFIIYALIISFFVTPSWILIGSNILGLLLFGTALITIDTFISSLTESQVIAAILSIGAGLLLTSISMFKNMVDIDLVNNIIDSIEMMGRYENFTMGMVKFSDVIFFLSIPVLFIFFTIKVLERRRWN